jgi:hypothetical protein
MNAWHRLLRIGRRGFLSLPVLLALPSLSGADKIVKVDPVTREKILAEYLDVLIPADDFTPSASSAELHKEILDSAKSDKAVMGMIDAGCNWLQKASKGRWLELNAQQRTRLVEWMEKSPEGQLPNAFFVYLRDRAMRLYYAKQVSWNGLGIEGPPQPVGYTALIRGNDA